LSTLPTELRELIETGPLAHLSTVNADGSPQVTVIWIGFEGGDLVSGHMSHRHAGQLTATGPGAITSGS
jgi:hypothetical protein